MSEPLPLRRCTFGCTDYQRVPSDNPWLNCPRCGSPIERVDIMPLLTVEELRASIKRAEGK